MDKCNYFNFNMIFNIIFNAVHTMIMCFVWHIPKLRFTFPMSMSL